MDLLLCKLFSLCEKQGKDRHATSNNNDNIEDVTNISL